MANNSEIEKPYQRQKKRLIDQMSKDAFFYISGITSLLKYIFRTLFYGFMVLPAVLIVWAPLLAADFNISAMLIDFKEILNSGTISLDDEYGGIKHIWILIGFMYVMLKAVLYPWASPNSYAIRSHMDEWKREQAIRKLYHVTQEEQSHTPSSNPDNE